MAGGERTAGAAERARGPALAGALEAARGKLGVALRALPRLWARSHVRWLAAILVVALALRVVWVVAVQPDPRDGRLDDTVVHYYTAQYLAEGQGFVTLEADPAERTPSAATPPGYPAALAAVFLLPGDDVVAGRVLNIVAGLALVAGVYYLGSRLWDRRAGLIAAGLIAVFPSHIYFSSLLMKETLFAALVVGILAMTLAWTLKERVSLWLVLLLGVTIAFAGFVRPEGLPFAAVIVLLWVIVHRNWRRVAMYTGALALGMALLMAPWIIRNQIELNSPVINSTGGGLVLVEAHHPDAGGRPAGWLSLPLVLRFQNLPNPEREVTTNNVATKQALTYAVNHIPRELSLAPQRLAWFFRGDRSVLQYANYNGIEGVREFSVGWQDRWGDIGDVYYYGVLGMMVFGLPFWWRRMRKQHLLLWGPFAVYVLLWAFVFVGNDRYHFPLLSVFALLGAIGLSAALQQLSEWRGGGTATTSDGHSSTRSSL